jgi:hypothetical protein
MLRRARRTISFLALPFLLTPASPGSAQEEETIETQRSKIADQSAFTLPPSGFEVGEPFPVVPFPSAEDGSPVSIADFRGDKVLLHVFASW